VREIQQIRPLSKRLFHVLTFSDFGLQLLISLLEISRPLLNFCLLLVASTTQQSFSAFSNGAP
jgi:hypothetical protein